MTCTIKSECKEDNIYGGSCKCEEGYSGAVCDRGPPKSAWEALEPNEQEDVVLAIEAAMTAYSKDEKNLIEMCPKIRTRCPKWEAKMLANNVNKMDWGYDVHWKSISGKHEN